MLYYIRRTTETKSKPKRHKKPWDGWRKIGNAVHAFSGLLAGLGMVGYYCALALLPTVAALAICFMIAWRLHIIHF